MAAETDDYGYGTLDDDTGSEISSQTADDNISDKIYAKVAQAFYPFYNKIFKNRNIFVSKVETRLTKADRSEPVEIYLSAYLGLGVLSGFIIGLVGSVLLWPTYNTFLVPGTLTPIDPLFTYEAIGITFGIPSSPVTILVVLLSTIVGGVFLTGLTTLTMGGVMLYMAAVLVPERNIYKRRTEIDVLLPDSVAFMRCLAASGMGRINIIRELAASEDTYGEVSVECQRIVHRIDVFSEDYHTAISNVAETTPSNNLATFLNDMLSTISSGGEIDQFLATQLDLFMNNVEKSQQTELDNLELFNEVYITISLVPVMGIIILSFAGAMGILGSGPLIFVIYFIIPFIQLAALLVITSLFQNQYGEGVLEPDETDSFSHTQDDEEKVTSAGIAQEYRGENRLMDQIYINEIKTRLVQFLHDPLVYVRRKPSYTFILSVPTALVFLWAANLTGNVLPSWEFVTSNPYQVSLFGFFIPMTIALAPFSYFYEIGLYRRGSITDGLTADLNKLANTNEQGITFQESLLITGQDNDTMLAKEMEEIYKKQQLRVPLGKAIIETNNRYRIPRLARIFRIIKSAQDVSDNITEVLSTAADLAETQKEIIEERKTRTRQQIGIIIIIFLVFLAAVVLMNFFLLNDIVAMGEQTSGATSQFSGQPIDGSTIELMFFHGAMIQGILGGITAGYIRTGKYQPGIKYSLVFSAITMVVWTATRGVFA